MIKFDANLADYCWIEQEQPEATRAGELLKFESAPQLFIEFKGTMHAICSRMGTESLSEWRGKFIAVRNGNYVVIGKVVTFESVVTEHEWTYRKPWGKSVKVPAEYRVTYFVDVTEMRGEE
ncbi:hypothetical protein [Priestia megaterium]|uniref:hypothetical protein n=1 Tax=Priestia megaterium TaxID=1404 RepID=UPI0039F6766D